MNETQLKLIEKIEGVFPYEVVENQLMIKGDCLEIMNLMAEEID